MPVSLTLTTSQAGEEFRGTVLFAQTPIPEPQVWAMFALGGIAVSSMRRRARHRAA